MGHLLQNIDTHESVEEFSFFNRLLIVTVAISKYNVHFPISFYQMKRTKQRQLLKFGVTWSCYFYICLSPPPIAVLSLSASEGG